MAVLRIFRKILSNFHPHNFNRKNGYKLRHLSGFREARFTKHKYLQSDSRITSMLVSDDCNGLN